LNAYWVLKRLYPEPIDKNNFKPSDPIASFSNSKAQGEPTSFLKGSNLSH
jgi:hypothetical protein